MKPKILVLILIFPRSFHFFSFTLKVINPLWCAFGCAAVFHYHYLADLLRDCEKKERSVFISFLSCFFFWKKQVVGWCLEWDESVDKLTSALVRFQDAELANNASNFCIWVTMQHWVTWVKCFWNWNFFYMRTQFGLCHVKITEFLTVESKWSFLSSSPNHDFTLSTRIIFVLRNFVTKPISMECSAFVQQHKTTVSVSVLHQPQHSRARALQ